MSLRTRLFVALLTLALAPTLVFAWFTLVQLHAATARWYQSGVESALEAAIETNRTTLTRLEATALERADSFAGTLPDFAGDPRQRDDLRREMRESGLDFTQLYERDSTGWRLASTVVPAGVMAANTTDLASEIPAALASDRLAAAPAARHRAGAPGGDRGALITRRWLKPSHLWRP